MSKLTKIPRKFRLSIAILALLTASMVVVVPKVFAGTLTNSSLLEIGGASNANPMLVSAGQQVVIDFTAATTGVPSSITENFNNFSGGTVNNTQTISSTGCTTYFPSATLLPGSLSAAGSGNTITISGATSLTSGINYCTILTSTTAVTNPSTPGVYSALLTSGSDSQNDAFDVLSSGGTNYSVTATVAPTFTMSLSGSTDSLGTLSATALSLSTGITAQVSTNAASGWFLWAEDSNAGLHSAQQSHTINSVTTGSNHTLNGGTIGTEAYALGVTAYNTTNYAYGGGTTGGGLSNTAFNEIAANGSPANGVTTVLHELADISAITPAATDYSDTITVIGTGSF